MEDVKPIWKSKTVLASLVTLVLSLLVTFGVIDPGDVDAEGLIDKLWAVITSVITAIASIVAIYGRVTAKTRISGADTQNGFVWMLLLLLIVLPGCGVWMSPTYTALYDEQVALAESYAEDAAAGNMTDEQMVKSLQLNAKGFRLFKDARDGKGGDDQ